MTTSALNERLRDVADDIAKTWLDRWGLRWDTEGGTVHMPPGTGSCLAEVDLSVHIGRAIRAALDAAAKVARDPAHTGIHACCLGTPAHKIAAAIEALMGGAA